MHAVASIDRGRRSPPLAEPLATPNRLCLTASTTCFPLTIRYAEQDARFKRAQQAGAMLLSSLARGTRRAAFASTVAHSRCVRLLPCVPCLVLRVSGWWHAGGTRLA